MYEEREGEKRRKRERDREVFVLKFVSKFVSEISLRYIHIARKREKEEVVILRWTAVLQFGRVHCSAIVNSTIFFNLSSRMAQDSF